MAQKSLPETSHPFDVELPLLDFFEEVAFGLERPEWLEPYATALDEASEHGGVQLVFAAPPQHGKTELTLRFLLKIALSPNALGRRHAYLTYETDRAHYVCQQFRTLLDLLGVRYSGTLDFVRIGNSEIRFGSLNGAITGYAIDGVCVVDDPFKGPIDAQSPAYRRRVKDTFHSVVFARRHATTSFVVMATRWHEEDLSGTLIEKGWKYINLKAIAEGEVDAEGRVKTDPLRRFPGESLWHKKPPEFFAEERSNSFWWSALYQGEPVSRGQKIFRDVTYYDELPNSRRGAFGVDLAYSVRTYADWSISIEGWDDGDALYVVDVKREQIPATEFRDILKAQSETRPGWVFRWYAFGPEKGVADFMAEDGIPIETPSITGDKLVRATGASSGWNRGKIRLPNPEKFDVPWLADFVKVVTGFTGINDDHDDDVDALAALWDELFGSDTALIRALQQASQ